MKIQFIKSPSPGAMEILARRKAKKEDLPFRPGAVGLIQGSLADMIMAADIAEKSAQVEVEEIRGVCPQHVTLIGIFGDIAALEAAIKAINHYFASN